MKKITFGLLLFICFSFNQTEDMYQTTITTISNAYNSKDTEKIFNLFSNELQSTFTKEKVEQFIIENQSSNGMIGAATFLMDDENNKRYLLDFDNTTMLLVLSIAADNKITHLSLEEY